MHPKDRRGPCTGQASSHPPEFSTAAALAAVDPENMQELPAQGAAAVLARIGGKLDAVLRELAAARRLTETLTADDRFAAELVLARLVTAALLAEGEIEELKVETAVRVATVEADVAPLRVVCAWCGHVIQEGAEPTSHGICPGCSSALEGAGGV